MKKIVIISASVRLKRNSHRVALFFSSYISGHKIGHPEVLDLNTYAFPVFNERLKYMPSPEPAVKEFAAKIAGADGIIIVTPEYNGGYPASLKNVVDLLYDEWHYKPVAITTVSSGAFAGSQVITSLLFTLWKMHAWVVPAMFPVARVQEAFGEDGTPADPAATDKRAEAFIKELVWCIEAKQAMSSDEKR